MGCAHSRQGTSYVYSVPITPLESAVGESQVYRNPLWKDQLVSTLPDEPGLATVQDAYLRSFKKFLNRDYLGTREVLPDGKFGPYKFKTYGQIHEETTALGSGFVNLNLSAPTSDGHIETNFVIIWSKNREEWLVSDIACMLYKMSLVPVYDTLGPETIHYVFSQTKSITIIVSNDHIDAVIKDAKNIPSLKNVVAMESVTGEQRSKAEEAGLRLLTFEEVKASGKQQKQDYKRVEADDLFTVNYTSGTTGLPKGVIISQRSQLSCAAAICLRKDLDVGPTDVYLSYLPLAHTLERAATLLFAMKGSCIGFYNGDVAKITSDIQELRPTIFVSVPRLFTRFYEKMQEGIEKLKGMKKSLAIKAVETKLHNLRTYGSLQHGIYDALVFNKMRQAMGGRVRFMLTGSAPIEPKVHDFLRIAMSIPLVEGYGQTETAAASFISQAEVPSFGHVGGPLGSVELKVVDVADMNYTSKDRDHNGALTPRGEVCLRGPTAFKGYYKDPERTAEALDKDGWVHTGDIGRINPDGSLSIIDRKKNIFKLAQGEYVASEKVENVYLTSKYIAEAFLYGDSLKAYTVVIAVPHKNHILDLAKELGIEGQSFEELCKNNDIKVKVLADMNKKGKESKINSFELAKQIHLEPHSFAEKGLMTPTFKVIRHNAKNYYQKIIDELYDLPLDVKRG